jgi:hypothetical protein
VKSASLANLLLFKIVEGLETVMEKHPNLKQLMTVPELRAFAEGLAKRADRVTAGRKQDSISRGWLAIEKLYRNAAAILPSTVVGLTLLKEQETWTNINRLASAIVTACDHAEPLPNIGRG